MKHRITITLVFALLQLLNTLNVSAEVYSGTCGTNLTWTLDTATGVLKIDGTGDMKNYVLPSQIPWRKYIEEIKSVEIGNDVTSIGKGAFYNCSEITTFKLGASIAKIDGGAFNKCRNVKSIVIEEGNTTFDSRDKCNAIIESSTNTLLIGCPSTTIPNGVTSIGDKAFSYTNSPKEIFIPASVTSIADNAFNGCTDINSIVVAAENTVYNSANNCNAIIETASNTPILVCDNTIITSNVTKIDVSVFRRTNIKRIKIEAGHPLYDSRDNCNAIIETKTNTLILGFDLTVIPSSVTKIGREAFMDCSFSSINLPSSLTDIGNKAFYRCSELASITLPSSITTINDSTFQGCSKLDNLVIPNSITSIGNYSFSGCKLTNITIPNSVTQMGIRAFSGCKFTSFTFPESITEIPNYIFQSCTNLQYCKLPNNLTLIGDGAFRDCNHLKEINIPEGVTQIGQGAFTSCEQLTEIKIPNTVKKIKDIAFSCCQGLTSLFIPKSVTRIGLNILSGCSNISKIVVDSENEYYDSRGGCNAIITTETGNLLTGCVNTVIPTGVKYIGWSAFSNLQGLKTITLPHTIISISCGAFSNCKNLTTVYCYATVPPELCLSALPGNITAIYVPETSVSSYKAAENWRSYNILAMDPATSVQLLQDNSSKNCKESPIYDIMGRKINYPTQKGIYIQNGVKWTKH